MLYTDDVVVKRDVLLDEAKHLKKNPSQSGEIILEQLGKNIAFDSDLWFCDKKLKSMAHSKDSVTIYFGAIPERFRTDVKNYAISRLIKNDSPSNVNNNIKQFKNFLSYLEEQKLSMDKLNPTIVSDFCNEVNGNKMWGETYKAQIWNSTRSFAKHYIKENQLSIPQNMFSKNPFYTDATREVEEKYIPEIVVSQLDELFRTRKSAIKTYLYVLYWIARTYPSRVTEVLAMKLDSIKPYGDEMYVLFKPTWKQNGGYVRAQITSIYIKYEGHGKFLVDLICEHQKYVKSIQNELPDELKGYLFAHALQAFNGNVYKFKKEISYSYKGGFAIPDAKMVRRDLNFLCEKFGIKDRNGEVYYLTSHQLRHNCITNRCYSNFTPEQIQIMTGHQGTAMIEQSYTHEQKEITLQQQRVVNGERELNEEDKPVLFRGRVMNIDLEREKVLLRNKRAYSLRGLGICSDILGCQSKIFECFSCDHFAPDSDKLDYFKEQLIYWKEKLNMVPENSLARENVIFNIEVHEKLIIRIEKAKEKFGE